MARQNKNHGNVFIDFAAGQIPEWLEKFFLHALKGGYAGAEAHFPFPDGMKTVKFFVVSEDKKEEVSEAIKKIYGFDEFADLPSPSNN